MKMRMLSRQRYPRLHWSRRLYTVKMQSMLISFIPSHITHEISWGRILSATGSVPLSSPSAPTLEIDPTRVSVTFVPADGSEPLHVLTNGEPENVDEERAKKILEMEDINIEVDLKLGSESATYWTCDFSYVSNPCVWSSLGLTFS